MKSVVALASVLLVICSSAGEVLLQENRNTCSECLNSGSENVWCSDLFSRGDGRSRCATLPEFQKVGCVNTEIFWQKSDQYLVEDNPINASSFSERMIPDNTYDEYGQYHYRGQVVRSTSQVRPQRIKMRLLPRVPRTVMLQTQHRSIQSSITISTNATENVHLTFTSRCSRGTGSNYTCKGTDETTNIFKIDVEVKSCPEQASQYNQTIQILPSGSSEGLKIDLEMICECNCEKSWNVEKNSPKCSGHGTLTCGICKCNPSRYGKYCECNAKESDSMNLPVRDLLNCHNQLQQITFSEAFTFQSKHSRVSSSGSAAN